MAAFSPLDRRPYDRRAGAGDGERDRGGDLDGEYPGDCKSDGEGEISGASTAATAAADGATSASSPAAQHDWEVDFEGKTASFPLSEEDDHGTRRVFFLIAPQVTIPPTVTITQPRTGRKLTTKSLPAIFAPGLLAGGGDGDDLYDAGGSR